MDPIGNKYDPYYKVSDEEQSEEFTQVYNSIISRFNVIRDELLYKDDNTSTGLTTENLKDILRNKSLKFWNDETGNPRYIIKRIGKGGEGKVYFFLDTVEPFAGAFKDAKITREEVQNEYRILCELQGVGIQFKPKRCEILLTSKEGLPQERFGYLGYYYDGSYLTKFDSKATLQDRLLDFYQLLSGLKTIHEKGYLHGDIKLENILVKKTDNIKYVHISDFGGARLIKDIEVMGRIKTPGFYLESDLNLPSELEQKRDVFAMGCVLYTALTAKHPYTLDHEKNLIEYKGFPKENRIEVPDDLKKIIEEMLSRSPEQRPTATKAFEMFNEYVKIKEF